MSHWNSDFRHDANLSVTPEPLQIPSIGVLGAGSMGQTIITGIMQSHVRVTGSIHATCRSKIAFLGCIGILELR